MICVDPPGPDDLVYPVSSLQRLAVAIPSARSEGSGTYDDIRSGETSIAELLL
jgi:hypothetical protein